jgi:hypothetical protein
LQACFVFPPDMAEVDTPINGLDRPVVYELYQQGYHKYLASMMRSKLSICFRFHL